MPGLGIQNAHRRSLYNQRLSSEKEYKRDSYEVQLYLLQWLLLMRGADDAKKQTSSHHTQTNVNSLSTSYDLTMYNLSPFPPARSS